MMDKINIKIVPRSHCRPKPQPYRLLIVVGAALALFLLGQLPVAKTQVTSAATSSGMSIEVGTPGTMSTNTGGQPTLPWLLTGQYVPDTEMKQLQNQLRELQTQYFWNPPHKKTWEDFSHKIWAVRNSPYNYWEFIQKVRAGELCRAPMWGGGILEGKEACRCAWLGDCGQKKCKSDCPFVPFGGFSCMHDVYMKCGGGLGAAGQYSQQYNQEALTACIARGQRQDDNNPDPVKQKQFENCAKSYICRAMSGMCKDLFDLADTKAQLKTEVDKYTRLVAGDCPCGFSGSGGSGSGGGGGSGGSGGGGTGGGGAGGLGGGGGVGGVGGGGGTGGGSGSGSGGGSGSGDGGGSSGGGTGGGGEGGSGGEGGGEGGSGGGSGDGSGGCANPLPPELVAPADAAKYTSGDITFEWKAQGDCQPEKYVFSSQLDGENVQSWTDGQKDMGTATKLVLPEADIKAIFKKQDNIPIDQPFTWTWSVSVKYSDSDQLYASGIRTIQVAAVNTPTITNPTDNPHTMKAGDLSVLIKWKPGFENPDNYLLQMTGASTGKQFTLEMHLSTQYSLTPTEITNHLPDDQSIKLQVLAKFDLYKALVPSAELVIILSTNHAPYLNNPVADFCSPSGGLTFDWQDNDTGATFDFAISNGKTTIYLNGMILKSISLEAGTMDSLRVNNTPSATWYVIAHYKDKTYSSEERTIKFTDC